MQAMVAGGVDAMEIGFPYSDPVMDGPTIQRASEILRWDAHRVQRTVEAVAQTGVPVLVMTYWNPVEHFESIASRPRWLRRVVPGSSRPT